MGIKRNYLLSNVNGVNCVIHKYKNMYIPKYSILITNERMNITFHKLSNKPEDVWICCLCCGDATLFSIDISLRNNQL